MLQLGDFQKVCPNGLSAALAHQIYTDLWKDDKSFNLEPHYDEDIQILFLKTEEGNSEQKVYLPVLHTKEIDFCLISKLQEKLSKSIIFLAIVDNTGNILYYQITQGFNERPSTSAQKKDHKLTEGEGQLT